MTGLERWLSPHGNTYRGEPPKPTKPNPDDMNIPMAPTDKTDKTPDNEVLAVLAVGGMGISVNERVADHGAATEQDYLTAYNEATTRLNAAWTHGVKIKELPNYPEIKRREEAAEAVWLEARRGGRHGELFGQFREALYDWEAALLEGLKGRKLLGK